MNVKVEIKCTNKDGSAITEVVELVLRVAEKNNGMIDHCMCIHPGDFEQWARGYERDYNYANVEISRVLAKEEK